MYTRALAMSRQAFFFSFGAGPAGRAGAFAGGVLGASYPANQNQNKQK